MVKLAQTRWLSREKVIATIIEQYDALFSYFQKESNVDKVDGARKILETLTNCGTKHMLLFLQYILQKVNALNIEFQSEHFRLHVLHAMVTTEYKSILSCFIKDEVIRSRKLSLIDPQDVRNQKSTNDEYLGGQALAHLINQPFQDENGTKRFKADCLRFLIELSNQMRKKLPLEENGLIAKLNVLNPKIAQDLSQSPESIIPLEVHFPHVVPENKLNELDDQWRAFRVSAKDLGVSADCVPEYRHNLNSVMNSVIILLDNLKFSLLSHFMSTMTVLPHSSASLERIFSQINRIKTKTTNSLKAETVDNRLLAKQSIFRKNQSCCSWEPNKKLIREVADSGGSRKFWWGDLKHKTSKIRMSSPKLRVNFRPKSEIQTIFFAQIQVVSKKKKKKGLHQN